MTPFFLLSTLLAALALALLLRRAPARPDGPATPADAAIAATRPSRATGVTLAVVVVVVALGGYAWVGSPRLLPVTPAAFGGDSPTPESTAAGEAIAATLRERAEKNPGEALTWYQWARAELGAGHMPEAVQGYRRALALRPKDPDLLADAADVMAVAAGGRLDGEPMQLVERALAADPNHVKALALQGSWLLTHRDVAGAIAAWQKAMKAAQPGDPVGAYIGHQIEALRAMAAGMAPPGAASEPAAGAAGGR